jgi:hypothetical protein
MTQIEHIPKKIDWPVHPFLLGIYPVLYLYSKNGAQVRSENLVWSVLLSLAVTVTFCWLSRCLFSNRQRAALWSTLALIYFFSYGHVFNLMNFYILPGPFSRHRYLLPGYTLMFLAIWFFIVKGINCSLLFQLTRYLNRLALGLVIFCLFFIKASQALTLSTPFNPAVFQEPEDSKLLQRKVSAKEMPDIYYIILDGYARADVLQEIYGYDNSEFILKLNALGFYIPSLSRSNYPSTLFSLSSALNMSYLNEALSSVPVNSSDKRILKEMIDKNKVASLMKSLGYQYIHISSGWSGTRRNSQADVVIQNQSVSKKRKKNFFRLHSFNIVFLRTTLLRPFIRGKVLDSEYQRLKKSFDNLEKAASFKNPKFVFSHIVAPHPPYVIDRNGNKVKQLTFYSNVWQPKANYIEQLIYVNGRVLQAVKKILENSKSPPIIIIHSDHGPALTVKDWNHPKPKALKERLSNFCTLYFPHQETKRLVPATITPVNLFRILFDAYFGTHYGILPNRHYFGNDAMPFRLVEVTQKLKG